VDNAIVVSAAVPVSIDGGERKSEVLLVPHQIEDLIREYFPECPDTMIAIAKAESLLDVEAVGFNRNGSKDCGVLQINSIHGYDCDWLKVPENNLRAGRRIFELQGLQAWSTFNNKRYKNFL
jgi:hypothetical protein